MQTEFTLLSPSAFMYLEPNEKSEVTDEILYGTHITKLENKQTGFAFCKTSYGYCGYLDCSHLKPKYQSACHKLIVTSKFCPLLEYPEYRYAPLLTVPSGSIIQADSIYEKNGFLGIKTKDEQFFIHKHHAANTASLFSCTDENAKRVQIVKTALSYLRTPYKWAGKTHIGIDCSGLCFMAYTRCGIGLYRDAEFDGRYVRKIPKNALKKADLVYYNGHVVMYIGQGYYIHSSATAGGVTINSFKKDSPLYLENFDGTEICCASSLAFKSQV